MVFFVVLLVFLISFIITGYLAGKNSGPSAKDFFIGGRSLNGWTLGLSASATANTGFVVVGAVGMGYALGAQSLVYAFAWFLGDLVFWYLLAHKVNAKANSADAVTVIDLISSKASSYLLKIFCALIIVSMLLVYSSAQFIASGKTLSAFWDVNQSVAILGAFVLVATYSSFGGFKSSVWTDVLQSLIMIGLAGLVLGWAWFFAGGSADLFGAWELAGVNYLDFNNGKDFGTTISLIAGFGFVALGYNLSQPQITTRIMAAKSQKEISRSRVVYILSLQFVWVSMCLIGMIAKVLLPEISDPEQALPLIALEFFPSLIAGLVLAGMFAAILSSIDSLLIAISSSAVVDLFRIRSGKSVFRVAIFGAGIIAALMAMVMSATVFQASVFAATLLAVTIGVGVLIVILEIPHTKHSLLGGMIVGLISALIWKEYGNVSFISDSMMGCFCALASNFLFYKTFPKSQENEESLTINK